MTEMSDRGRGPSPGFGRNPTETQGVRGLARALHDPGLVLLLLALLVVGGPS